MQRSVARVSRVRDSLARGAGRLRGGGARLEAEWLLCHVLGESRAWLVAHSDDEIDEAHRLAFAALIARRAAGEPIAYLTGTCGFHSLVLEVTPDVLIPRPETELMVELVLQRIPRDASCDVADLGTGSGAIALAIARERPRTRILATDMSEAALAVARRNAERLGLRNIEFAQGDWCTALGEMHVDLIVSNPPYIADADPHLAQGDLRFEPRSALASGADGLDAIHTIVREAHAHLREGGWLLFEHGFDQGEAARVLLARYGYGEVFTERDMEARERASGGCWTQPGIAASS